jgi:cytochrome P450
MFESVYYIVGNHKSTDVSQCRMKLGWGAGFLQPGPSHSNQRKMLRRGIGPQKIGSYDTTIELEVAKFMPGLEAFQGHPFLTIQRYVEPSPCPVYYEHNSKTVSLVV